jgi:hypothetical protein
MEASGHYYTVYFTSLAVGFAEDVAYKHALLCQMPDQVNWLDATTLHSMECSPATRNNGENLSGTVTFTTSQWRYLVEYANHALPGKGLNAATRSSGYQRQFTTKQLVAESPVSLKFGLLLHRLGDSYAHSAMDNESTMYTVSSGAPGECLPSHGLWGLQVNKKEENFGHLRHGHLPDYPFLRQQLFYSYLKNLYDVLYKKANDKRYIMYRRKSKLLVYNDVHMIFYDILNNPEKKVAKFMRFRGKFKDDTIADVFISSIREACYRYMGVTMKPYAPEKNELQTLKQFLHAHPLLKDAGITETTITKSLRSMVPPVKQQLVPQ